MTEPNPAANGKVTRDFTVAVFVVADGRVLLHMHRKLGKWLPPGGHIERDELPDHAAVREVEEESGLSVDLVGPRGIPTDYQEQPVQLVVPAGIQLETITQDHEHIDLVYFARLQGETPDTLPSPVTGFRWFRLEDLGSIPVTDEVRDWCDRAIRELAR